MEKSGEKATRSRNPKQRKNIVNFPPISQAGFSKPSTPPIETVPSEMGIPAPVDGQTASEKKLMKFLGRYKIGKRSYELSAKIGDVIYRAIGGKNRAIETLKFSKNPQAVKLLEFCERLSWSTRDSIPIEALCLCAGVDPTTIAGALVLAARDVSRMESALITMREHPNMVQATAHWGQMFADNAKDREMFHKATGWLPASKGSSVNVNVFDPKQVAGSEEEDDGTPTLEGVFGSDPMEIENWGEERRKLLEAGK